MNGRRLMITHMELENFKSYYGVQTIGPYHKRFSSVVGPNGSGKSNVIDAMLFVFGKRAKQLRLSKVSELIHKSSLHKNLDYARVSVFFQLIIDNEQSEDEFEIVEGSAFTITRIAYANNQSKYLIGSKNSSSTEVGLLLRQYGVDLDNNRFLILQGEVEQIAMMKPKAATAHEEGLLEYLEDIIGSNRFVKDIDEAAKEWEEMNEQRVEKVNKLKIAEKERDNLSDSKIEAELFLEKEREIRRKKNVLYQILESIAVINMDENNKRSEKLSEKLAAEKSKGAAMINKLKEAKEKHEQATKDRTTVYNDMQQCKSEYDAFERRDVKLIEDTKHCKSSITKLQAALTKETKKEAEIVKEAEVLKLQIVNYEETLGELEAKKSAEEKQIESLMSNLQDSTADLRVAMEKCQSKLTVAEKSVSEIQAQKDAVVMSVELLNNKVKNAKDGIEGLKQKRIAVLAERDACQQKLAAVEAQLNGVAHSKDAKGVEWEARTLQQQLIELSREEQSLQREIKESVQRIEECRANLLQRQEQSRGSESVVVQRLLQASHQKNGALRNAGILGRLGDLATVSKEHDVAVSTACAGMLDYLVVETTEGAQQCIQFLRESNQGRASFIVLSQLQDWEAKLAQMAKPGASRPPLPRLFDLVQPLPGLEEKVRPALYMAMRDTLVAKDLDAAVKTAYVGDKAQWRVVTLGGDLIDTSGSMSGGGRDVKSGGMKLTGSSTTVSMASKASSSGESATEDEQKIQLMEAAIQKLQTQLASVRASRAQGEQRLEQLQQMAQQLNQEITKLKMALKKFNDQEVDIGQQITRFEADDSSNENFDQQMLKYQKEIQNLDSRIKAQAEKCDLMGLKAEAASLQRQMKGVGGPALSKAQSKVDSFNHQIETLSGSLSTKRVEESNCQKQLAKTLALRVKTEADLLKAQEKFAMLEKERNEMTTDAEGLLNARDAAQGKLTGLDTVLKQLSKEYQDLKDECAKIHDAEQVVVTELEKVLAVVNKGKADALKLRAMAEEVRREFAQEWRELAELMETTRAAALQANGKAPLSTSPEVPNGAEEMKIASEEVESSDSQPPVNEFTLPILLPDELLKYSKDDLTREISAAEAERDKIKSGVNMKALQDYIRKDVNYKCRQVELDQITELRDQCHQRLEQLRRQRLEEFMAGFSCISLKLKEMYQMITLGGDAELELLDSMDPFSEGIVFSVRPPKKSWKNISNLSGGEKTLSSLALVFALHHYKPTPLYVMDEIDAALDFKNVSIVANYIKERTKNAQFIIISLRNNMFELADRLVGIYKTNDATKSVTINPKLFEASCNGGRGSENNLIMDEEIGNGVMEKNKTLINEEEVVEEPYVKRALADVTNSIGMRKV